MHKVSLKVCSHYFDTRLRLLRISNTPLPKSKNFANIGQFIYYEMILETWVFLVGTLPIEQILYSYSIPNKINTKYKYQIGKLVSYIVNMNSVLLSRNLLQRNIFTYLFLFTMFLNHMFSCRHFLLLFCGTYQCTSLNCYKQQYQKHSIKSKLFLTLTLMHILSELQLHIKCL